MRASEFTTEAVFDSEPSINVGTGKIAQTPGKKTAQPNQQVVQNPEDTSNQVGTTGVTNNTVVKAGTQQDPQQLQQQQQIDQQKQTQADLLKNLQQLKTAVPGINVQKDVMALSKNPMQQTPQDKQNLAGLTTQLQPILKNPSGVQSLKQLISKMQSLDTKQQQDLEKKNQASLSTQVQPQANKS